MTTLIPVAVSPLRQRLIDEMDIRRFGFETQRNYIRDVGRFATFLGRSPDTATAEDVRRFQIEQSDLSCQPARDLDPGSASNIDPGARRDRTIVRTRAGMGV